MPLTLDSTRALRGEKRRWTLIVMGHGRWEYLVRTIDSLDSALHHAGLDLFNDFDRRILSVDGPECGPTPALFERIYTGKRSGLTANLAQAWGALTPEDEWVFHLEEDFLIHDAPLEEMADTLDAYRQVANMVLVRQPWGAHEIRAGSVLKAQTYDMVDRGGWLEHHGGFWLNPFVAHASVLRSLVPGVETELSNQCRARGLSFGWWGGVDDPPRVEHIGAEGGMGSPGWKP